MILICQWYTPDDPARLAELHEARQKNESSHVFTRCLYLDGDSKRWNYAELFDLAESQFRGQVCVIANTDIVFGHTSKMLPELCCRNRLVTLTRWETPHSPRMLGHFVGERFFSGTQDAWVFAGGMLPRLGENVPLGSVACDNCIVGEAVAAGVEVLNPSLSIRTRHVHADEARGQRASVYGTYGYPELCCLNASGLVLCHEWQPGSRMDQVKPKLAQTPCQR